MRWKVALRTMLTSPRFARTGPLESGRLVTRWWERRRPFFNIVVIAALLVALGTLRIFQAMGAPIDAPSPLIFLAFDIAGYLIAANLCYSGGAISERVARRIWGAEMSSAFGQVAFALGVIFSALLTLCPIVVALIWWSYLLFSTES